jgi:hypothetical protein
VATVVDRKIKDPLHLLPSLPENFGVIIQARIYKPTNI